MPTYITSPTVCSRASWLPHMRDMSHSNSWHDSFTCLTCLIQVRDKSHSHAWHGSCPRRHATNEMLVSPMTATRVWHYSFTLVTWLTHMRDMTHSHATWLTSTDITSPTACSWAPWLPHVPDMTHSHSCMYVQNIFWEFLWHPCPATQTHPWVCTDSWKRLNILAPAKLPRSNRTVKPLWFS